MKLKTRKSQHCPRACKRVDCREVYNTRVIMGQKITSWELKCRTLDQIEGKAMNQL